MNLKFILDITCDCWNDNCRLDKVVECKKTFNKFCKNVFDIDVVDYSLTIDEFRSLHGLN